MSNETTTPAARDEYERFSNWFKTSGLQKFEDTALAAWEARAALAESELAEVRQENSDIRAQAGGMEMEIDELRAELERVKQFRGEWEKTCLDTKQRFKNFHSSLCDRFGYTHDNKYWWRDLISLEEHIAKAAIGAGEGEAE